jgi:hypothetical protein
MTPNRAKIDASCQIEWHGIATRRTIMRRTMAIAASFGTLLISVAAFGSDAERPSPNLLVFGQHAGAAPAPLILRGSVAEPQAVAAAQPVVGGQTQIVAGQQLWMIDSATGEVQSCLNLQTSTVGVRDIRCTIAELGNYSRTFGPNFHP